MTWRPKSVPWEAVWKWLVRIAALAMILFQGLSTRPTGEPVFYIAALAMMGITITIPYDKKRRDE